MEKSRNEEAQFRVMYEQYLSWKQSQEDQQDAYEFERSFDVFCQQMNQQMLELATQRDGLEGKKKVHTKFGQVRVSASHCLAPVGKEGFRMSPYYQELACLLGQALPFDQASAMAEKLLGRPLSDKQIERLCHHYGEVLEEQSKQEADYQLDEALHYGLMDGSMVYVRAQGWKEIKLGRVFAAGERMQEKERPTIRQSRYAAHLGSHEAFLEKFEPLLSGKKQLVAIADGARWIWDYWGSEHPEAVQILDYFHVVEKIGQWAVTIFSDANEGEQWIGQQEEYLLSDQTEEVIAAVQAINAGPTHQKQQHQLLTYLNNNVERMRYKTYRDQGYCIGSGAIEAAHRNVIQNRLKLSGQRWTAQGLQQVANLRVAYLSNQWLHLQKAVRNAA